MDRRQVLRAIAVIEICSLVLALLLGVLLGVPWWTRLHFSSVAGIGVLIGAVTPLLSLGPIAWLRAHGHPNAGAYVDSLLIPAVRPLTLVDVFWVALASGLAEELLFRATLQPVLGLLPCSLLFGALHTGARDLVEMGIWAGLAGFGLGALYIATGTIWCPILCHATHNFVTILLLRRKP